MINEIDVDQKSRDTNEFIELYDGGTGNTSLDGYSIVLFNGGNDKSYKTIDLTGHKTTADGYFVIGSSTVVNVNFTPTKFSLQNGADAIALYHADASEFRNGSSITTTNLIDAVVYDTDDKDDTGLLALLNGNQPQINEHGKKDKENHSSQRVINGSGGLRNTDTYTQATPTPGAENTDGSTTPPTNTDTEAPTAPSNLTASNITETQVTLTWETATDNIGVSQYQIFNGTVNLGSSTNTTFNLTGLTANTTYSFTVKAMDAATNSSLASNTASATTLESTTNNMPITIMINEIDVDQKGTDTNEFIELYDGGAGNTSLDNHTIVLFNGGKDKSYKTIDLTGYKTTADGYFVIGNSTVANVNLVEFAKNGIQNGADAIALYHADASEFHNGTPITTTDLIDAIVYDTNDNDDAGLLTLLNAKQPQVNENAKDDKDRHSLQRIVNGSGGLRNTDTYTQARPTPGKENTTVFPIPSLTTITIAAARAKNDGDEIQVKGILTVTDQFAGAAYIQDATGGIAIFDKDVHGKGKFKIGDEITVQAFKATDKSQTQLINIVGISNHGAATNPIIPKEITLNELAAHPAELVKISNPIFPSPGNMFFGNSNYKIFDNNNNTANLRIDIDVNGITGLAQPQSCSEITGVVGRYYNFQLIPRLTSDINCAKKYQHPPLDHDKISKDKTLDIVTWNIEWFGDEKKSPAAGNPNSDEIQKEKVKQVLLNLDADIIAVQEIIDIDLFKELIAELPAYDFILSDAVSYPNSISGTPQKLGFIYKKSVVSLKSSKALLKTIHPYYNGNDESALQNFPDPKKSRFFASGRLPFLMTADITIDNQTKEVNFIVLHARANTSAAKAQSKYDMRKYDVETLKKELDANFSTKNIVLLGDYNDDVDQTVVANDVIGDATTYDAFVQDASNYTIVTSALSKANFRSYASMGNMIDHITISNELTNNYLLGSEKVHYEFYNNLYEKTTSDHFPVSVRLQLTDVVEAPEVIIKIADARTKVSGEIVSITGILTVADQFAGSAYIQDETGGIAIFDDKIHGEGIFKIGDQITVKATKSTHNGQIQLINVISAVTSTTAVNPIIPKVITLAELANHPGELVQILNPSFPLPGSMIFGNSNIEITDANNNKAQIRVDADAKELTGLAQPENCDQITGVVGRYNATLQLLPRLKSDLSCAKQYEHPSSVNDAISKDKTLDIVTWNIEWFGDQTNSPAAGNPNSDEIQKEKVKEVLLGLDADVIAVQEIADIILFKKLVTELPAYDFILSNAFSYPNNTTGTPQKLGFIYKKSVVNFKSSTPLLKAIHPYYNGNDESAIQDFPHPTKASFFASGRLPFLMTADVTLNNTTEEVSFIVLHARANNNSDAQNRYDMRKYDIEVLKKELDTNFSTKNVVLLGDYNDDVDQTVVRVNTSTSTYDAFIQDPTNYTITTTALSKAGFRSYPSFPNLIDHITISNELNDNYLSGSEKVHYELYNNEYTKTASDHLPVSVRLKFIGNYTVKYIAGNNGSITGNLAQTIEEGKATSEVKAIADAGYEFVKWSDNNTSETRTDIADADKEFTAEFVKTVVVVKNYTVKYTAGNNGTITGDLSQTIEEGKATSQVKAIADTGYEFVKWSDNNTSETRTDIADADKEFTAEFVKTVVVLKNYTVKYTAGNNGTITGDLSQNIEEGNSTSQVKAIADAGYKFVKWSDNNTSETRTDIADADKEFTAEFVAIVKVVKNYTVKYTAGNNGTITGDLSQNIEEGNSTSQVKAIANTGYEFVKWSDNNTSETRTDIADADKEFTAEFVKTVVILKNYTVKYTAGNNGTITGDLSQNIEEGNSTSEVKAIADAGYKFVKWSDGNTSETRTDIADADKEFTAEFVKTVVVVKNYTVKYTAGNNGTITGNLSQTIEEGKATSQVKAIADAGYEFVKWSDNNTSETRTDIADADKEFTAEFVKVIEKFTVKYTAGNNGTITGDLSQNIEEGNSTSQVKAIADAGYEFVKWSDNNTSETRTDIADADKEFTAEFVKVIEKFTVKYIAGNNGTITGNLAQTIEEGNSTSQVKAIADAGYEFVKWSDNNTSETRTDIADANKEFTAEFVKTVVVLKNYTVKYTAGNNGTITGDLAQTIEEGKATSQVKAIADAGYKFVKWSDNNTSETRTDIADADKEFKAEFVAIVKVAKNYTVKYTAGNNGSITGNLTQTIEEGNSTSQVKAIANAGYEFVKWSDNNTSETRTDIADADKEFKAEFVKVIEKFTIKYIAGNNGSITGNLAQTIEEGKTTSEVKATADAGYEFVKWSDGNTSETRTDIADADKEFTAEFVAIVKVAKNYTVKYTAGNNGTITGDLAQTIEEGKATSQVKAIADAGYEFVKWSDNNTSQTRTDIADADKEFTAEFVKTLVVVKNYTVKYTAGNNGTITGNLAQTIEEGKTTSEVKAIADAGYEFVKWSDNNTSDTRTDIADTDKEFTAEFVQVVKVVKNGITASKGFSPNGDANNDTWVIQNIDRYPNNTVKVFNRWGKKVYYKKGYQNTWDATATDTGTKLPVGSYIYMINLNEAGTKPVQGMIYINY
ncbi:InlB B-repeat-containing protein [Tenacibaculum finnmarkense]|uniref:T9SS type B sorting domain-containing protein n=1 Tax=Tenacibaculum finnmarkense genomovar finnmarkense TaxID=1458503 RepID=A0AAP1RE90_9FLAO|nr:InlB B-repeat-containing protein [Tenacibaculum finnmarkense]MBE7652481.1 T9SS type B sorting domain-containing protein [Tenacibaculum finnmarkense genomovar finnmarkense]MBE7694709.1 T9SS type B sorting domain-containing protein [Tenacibaculum finnmarkense genomovar finnmarkense]MCG8731170.1 T9SS type B sorting domain-containing protein [Tenacibaculum finnmarkense]MCG8772688.1 T9SS type B sorting domain-containing protein [Tenacibaculum finnmarkense]MCG8775451.1 T9SS type B sorting domain-